MELIVVVQTSVIELGKLIMVAVVILVVIVVMLVVVIKFVGGRTD